MKKFLESIFIFLVCISLVFCISKGINPKTIDGGRPWSNSFDNSFGCNTEDITNMYADYVEKWKQEVKNSFDEAEVKVYNITPTPDIVGPHEDPKKCICKGTGVIKQGDGHTTPCPFHGNKFSQPLLIWEK
jgi:hypothetical protein